MNEQLNCRYCGRTIDPTQIKDGRCPHCGQPVRESAIASREDTTADKKAREAPRGISVGPFLISLGILHVVIAALCVKCESRDLIGVMAICGLGGASLIVIGVIYGSIYSWIAIRRRGSRALWALSTLVLLFSSVLLVVLMGVAPPLISYASMRCNPRFTAGLSPEVTQRMGVYRVIDDIAWALKKFDEDVPEPFKPITEGDEPEMRVDYLYGNIGKLPEFSGGAHESWGSTADNMHFVLATNGRTEPRFRYKVSGWDGPYLLREVPADPWGYAYIVSVSGLEKGSKPGNKVWCISAGPNHIVETPVDAAELKGDDLGRHLDEMPYISSAWTCSPTGCSPRKR